MADISTFNNFFDKFAPKSGFAAKLLSQRKEWESSTIQNIRQILPPTFVHCFQGQFDIHLGYEIRSFLFLEQCFQLSLSDEIVCKFFENSKYIKIFEESMMLFAHLNRIRRNHVVEGFSDGRLNFCSILGHNLSLHLQTNFAICCVCCFLLSMLILFHHPLIV